MTNEVWCPVRVSPNDRFFSVLCKAIKHEKAQTTGEFTIAVQEKYNQTTHYKIITDWIDKDTCGIDVLKRISI